jgi:D-cysteine desulfhydrase family pyridoxal phosphate-dependent enzyme
LALDLKMIEKTPLAHLPTALEPLPRLSSSLGGPEIWIKRDDQTGLAFGGNKTRKLEYLTADAMLRGARTLITRGALQSNHCRQTAAAAARLGFDCILVLKGSAPEQRQGNILLDDLLGAEFVWAEEGDPEVVLGETVEKAQKADRAPYLIPYGGSNPLGVYAYAEAMAELLRQDDAFDRILFASSSGGTQAGLLLGAKLHEYRGSITGISVDLSASELTNRVSRLIQEASEWLGREVAVIPKDISILDDFLGEGYGVVGSSERNAITQFAQLEGILLDPVYTGRAAGGMMELIRQGWIGSEERILFWHTGGTPALFAYADDLVK